MRQTQISRSDEKNQDLGGKPKEWQLCSDSASPNPELSRGSLLQHRGVKKLLIAYFQMPVSVLST